jgi:hypothetical protein
MLYMLLVEPFQATSNNNLLLQIRYLPTSLKILYSCKKGLWIRLVYQCIDMLLTVGAIL